MNGIASLLDEAATTRVEHLWRELEVHCDLVGVKATPFPHFSWQVTEAYHLSRLESVLHSLALQARPFSIHTAGLGLFTGETPVVYISIVKDETLMRLHTLLWEQLHGIAINPSQHYSPGEWVPHITLAYNDVNLANIDCAIKYLTFQSFDWEIQIDNLILVAQVDDQPTETVRYRFGH
jgi:2'-5' RNA ligase